MCYEKYTLLLSDVIVGHVTPYRSGEEDMEYWYFGSTTENALGTYQASNGLPDTGLTCINTWKSLFGEEKFALGPEAALATVGDGDYPDDLSDQNRVFLLGEGRFEQKKKKKAEDATMSAE